MHSQGHDKAAHHMRFRLLPVVQGAALSLQGAGQRHHYVASSTIIPATQTLHPALTSLSSRPPRCLHALINGCRCLFTAP